MAGDLVTVDMSFDDKVTFTNAGATELKEIYPSDKSWYSYHEILDNRIALKAPPANRVNLPAHAYVTFSAANRYQLREYCAVPVQKAKLNNALMNCKRRLGVVTANPNLQEWPETNDGYGAANILIAALDHGNVIIEYYKQGGSPVMDVFGTDPQWTKTPE